MAGETLLVGLAHPDDEVGVAGTILAQRDRGDRVVIVWLTRGEMTGAFGDLAADEVARRREEQGHRAGELLGVETRFLDFPDTGLEATRDAVLRVARLICEIQPTGLLTWGEGWVRGIRHPDHQACGRIFRDAVTLSRIARAVAPSAPHRVDVPVFTFRDAHSALPAVGIDVTPYRERIQELADFYLHGIGFGDPEWIDHRLRVTGERWGCRYAEELDAWETVAGTRLPTLLPAEPLPNLVHPTHTPGGGLAAG